MLGRGRNQAGQTIYSGTGVTEIFLSKCSAFVDLQFLILLFLDHTSSPRTESGKGAHTPTI